MSVEASCHCGAVRVICEAPREELNDCRCSICRRYAALWAYYDPALVRIVAPQGTDEYVWNERMLAFHRCRTCGCLTHWAPTDGVYPRMGVNVRMMPPAVWADLPVRVTAGPQEG